MKNILRQIIAEEIKSFPLREGVQTRWGEPLIGFADACDRRFLELKTIVSPSHALPQDILPGARTVIAYFIPFENKIARSNFEGQYSSREWAVAYIETNQLIAGINERIYQACSELGYQSSIIPATHNFDQERLISDWSHRHVAYLAGLGKFGLNNMLITAKGCCGRIGSVVTNIMIEPDPVTDNEYCLYKAKGTCKKCIERCAGKALQIDHFDRKKCYGILLENDKRFPDLGLADVCGKCVVNLPCTFTNPVK
ncbi:MAG: epoxyqueuosine reductase [Peptococcaceae bacterium]|nr:epoxyqueuosine reductase [Peptococcaceae bacterium]